MSKEVKEKGKLYKKLLSLAKEAKEQIQIPFQVRKAEKDLEMKILEVEQKIAEADLVIEEAKTKYPADWATIIGKIDSKELLERQLKQFKNLQKELFED